MPPRFEVLPVLIVLALALGAVVLLVLLFPVPAPAQAQPRQVPACTAWADVPCAAMLRAGVILIRE